MNESVSKTGQKNTIIFWLIVVAFAAPVILGWLYATSVLDWRARGAVNNGVLVVPPVDLAAIGAWETLDRHLALGPSEWAMLYLDAQACTAQCRETMAKLRTIDTVLGHKGARLKVLAITHHAATDRDPVDNLVTDAALLKKIAAALAAHSEVEPLPLIAFVDWRRQLMMVYPPNTPPKAIKQDISRLLRGSKIR